MINNACLSKGGILSACSYADFNYVLQVGVTAPYFLSLLLLPHFNAGASIVTVSYTHLMDFLLATDYRSMPFGGCGYELYSLKDGAFNQIDLSNITKGTPFTIKVHENQQTAQITANHAVTVVPLSDWELQGYKQYGLSLIHI